MQLYTIVFIIVSAVHVSGGFSADHQELKNCTHSIWYVLDLLLLQLAWLGWNSSKPGTYQTLRVQFLSF
jgi:hypothetical protein